MSKPMSKPFLATTVAAACALALPSLAHSRQLTLTTQLKNYGGDGAYLAVYLTDSKGAYARTLWVAGARPSSTNTWPTGIDCPSATPGASLA